VSEEATPRDRGRLTGRVQPRWTALALLLLVAAALLWWLGLSDPGVPQSVHTAGELSEPVPEPEPARPVEPKAIKPVAPAVVVTPKPVPGTVAPTAPPLIVQPPDTRGFVDALQQRFEADQPDDQASRAEAALRQVLHDAGAPAGLEQSIVCRRILCKLELHWMAGDDAAYHRVVERLMGDNAKFFATRPRSVDATGGILVDAYWVRR
jgi:hypothetical protein